MYSLILLSSLIPMLFFTLCYVALYDLFEPEDFSEDDEND